MATSRFAFLPPPFFLSSHPLPSPASALRKMKEGREARREGGNEGRKADEGRQMKEDHGRKERRRRKKNEGRKEDRGRKEDEGKKEGCDQGATERLRAC